MRRDARLLFGPLAAALFAAGVTTLPLLVPGYDAVRQTVSEIGEMDSPMRWPFGMLLFVVAVCVFVFALGLRAASLQARRNGLAAYLSIWMGIAAAGIGVFAFPHPLHNVFGLSELIGYQAPLAFALAWRNDPNVRGAIRFSWAMYALLLASLALNLSTLDRGGVLFASIRPFFGLVQRSLFACFFIWAAGVGWMLWRRPVSER
jgi:hypothetical membrane protein